MCPILSYQNIATLTPVYRYTTEQSTVNRKWTSLNLSAADVMMHWYLLILYVYDGPYRYMVYIVYMVDIIVDVLLWSYYSSVYWVSHHTGVRP